MRFVADFPHDDAPPGSELAGFVHACLKAAGLDSGAPENHEDWAWQILTRESGVVVESIVGLVDDSSRQWLITNESRKAKEEGLLSKVCAALQAALRRDDRFKNVAWHDRETFDKPGDQPGDSP